MTAIEVGERPARRRRLTPGDRRQALINSALNLFNTRTYDEVSVDDIAADAGVSRPLVYHYYGGKAGVFIAALRQAGDDVASSICAAALADPANWLRAGLSAFLDQHPGQSDRVHGAAGPRLAAGRGGPAGPRRDP